MLARFNPKDVWAMQPLRTLSNDLERFFGDCSAEGGPVCCRMDVREDDAHFFIDADVPGFKKDDIEITLEDNVLTVRGENSVDQESTRDNFHVRERRSGSFQRKVQLPSTVDPARVQAALHNGVLTVTLDKKAEVRPRRIDVQVS